MDDLTLPEQIANQLRRNILSGKLPPGSTVKERDNAAEMGVSRTPMREAIRILAREGLVDLRPSRSPLVADPTLKDVEDSIEVLNALEVLSGRLACENATDADISGIRALQEEMELKFDEIDPVMRFEIDMNFHLAIARASHNKALANTHGAFLARMWRARFLSARTRRTKDRVLRQHRDIVRGLEERDAAKVTGEIEAHLEHLMANIRQDFEKRQRSEDELRAAADP